MNNTEQTVADLTAYPTELPWLEFKENWFEPHALGEYLSALSNAAALAGRSHGYMVWGVNDATHEIVGTDFTWHRDVKHEPLEHYLARQLSPDLAFAFDVETLVTVKASFDLAQSSGDSMFTILGVDLYRCCHIHFQ